MQIILLVSGVVSALVVARFLLSKFLAKQSYSLETEVFRCNYCGDESLDDPSGEPCPKCGGNSYSYEILGRGIQCYDWGKDHSLSSCRCKPKA